MPASLPTARLTARRRTTNNGRSKPTSTLLTRFPMATSLRGRSLLDEARAAIERAQHDDIEQAYRETAYDCYA
jgi:hypothetical protein